MYLRAVYTVSPHFFVGSSPLAVRHRMSDLVLKYVEFVGASLASV